MTERRSAGSRLRASLRSHHVALGLGLGLVGVALAVRSAPGASGPRALEPLLARARVALPSAPLDPAEPESPTFDDRPLRLPSGLPAALPCEGARAIVAQVRGSLAMPPSPVEPQAFAEALADWLDPHGLWSVAPDAPLSAELRREAPALLAELEARPGSGPCRAFGRSGAALETWVTGLRTTFDTAYARTHSAVGRTSPTLGFERASFAPFEDGAVTKKASWLAAELGRATGEAERGLGPALGPYAQAARERFLPTLDADAWARVTLAAAVRAYVPLVDAHGAWAPLEEELSIYDLGLERDPPPRAFSRITRTALGVRIDQGALKPLQDGDLVLRIGAVPLAGVSVEQVEQLSVLTGEARGAEGGRGEAVPFVVLRPGHTKPLTLEVAPEPAPRGPSVGERDATAREGLRAERVRYGDGSVAVLRLVDVPDDLGPKLGGALGEARRWGDLRGLVLDLRGNGGGSTEGAIEALAYFLPGATLFPMRRRDGGIEVERAPQREGPRWESPVAVLVDGDTASAAEMLAGALASYRRGVVVGERTYGKGCAQEYLDDDAHAGVLRLTTLLFALPDGSPLQKTGLSPDVRLSLPVPREREAGIERAFGAFRSLDARDAAQIGAVPWSAHFGRVGPCRDETVCRALRAVGTARAASR